MFPFHIMNLTKLFLLHKLCYLLSRVFCQVEVVAVWLSWSVVCWSDLWFQRWSWLAIRCAVIEVRSGWRWGRRQIWLWVGGRSRQHSLQVFLQDTITRQTVQHLANEWGKHLFGQPNTVTPCLDLLTENSYLFPAFPVCVCWYNWWSWVCWQSLFNSGHALLLLPGWCLSLTPPDPSAVLWVPFGH